MSYWAHIDKNNKVLQVTVGVDDLENAYQWLLENLGGRWIHVTLDNYPGVGWTYIDDLGFYSPKPYDSWILEGLIWKAPKDKPEGDFYWDESELNWIPVPEVI